MGVKFLNGEGFERALDLIIDFVNTCPHCSSEEAVTENDSDPSLLECAECAEEISEKTHFGKAAVFKLLQSNGLIEQAQHISGMSEIEFEDFMANNIY